MKKTPLPAKNIKVIKPEFEIIGEVEFNSTSKRKRSKELYVEELIVYKK